MARLFVLIDDLTRYLVLGRGSKGHYQGEEVKTPSQPENPFLHIFHKILSVRLKFLVEPYPQRENLRLRIADTAFIAVGHEGHLTDECSIGGHPLASTHLFGLTTNDFVTGST